MSCEGKNRNRTNFNHFIILHCLQILVQSLHDVTLNKLMQLQQFAATIVANCPGISGTVLDFLPVSRKGPLNLL